MGGTAYCWGDNQLGQLGQSGDHAVPSPVAGGHAFASIAAGTAFTCGITDAGEALCWGDNEYGQLGTGSADPSPAAEPAAVSGGLAWTRISAGDKHACGITADGVTWCWGAMENAGSGPGEPSLVPQRVGGQP